MSALRRPVGGMLLTSPVVIKPYRLPALVERMRRLSGEFAARLRVPHTHSQPPPRARLSIDVPAIPEAGEAPHGETLGGKAVDGREMGGGYRGGGGEGGGGGRPGVAVTGVAG